MSVHLPTFIYLFLCALIYTVLCARVCVLCHMPCKALLERCHVFNLPPHAPPSLFWTKKIKKRNCFTFTTRPEIRGIDCFCLLRQWLPT